MPGHPLAEQIVLGAAMLDPGTADDLARTVAAASFERPAHTAIWVAIRAVRGRGEPAEPGRVLAELGDTATRFGGAGYLATLLEAVPALASAPYYAGQVAAEAEHRAQIELAERHRRIVALPDPQQRAAQLGELGALISGMAEVADAAGPSPLGTLRAQLVDTDGLDSIPDPEPLIGEDILFRDSLAWMVGKPGCMKSFTALDMAGCVATGETWQGYQVSKGTVLYLVAEGVRGIKKRVRAWEASMGRRMSGVQFLPVAVQSKNAAQWSALVELAAELHPVLVVLDTQARITVGVEENSNTEMGEFVHQAERLRAASGACVLIVHHIGRNGDTGRGATVLDGVLSTIVKVAKDDDKVTLECQKNKDGVQWENIDLRAVPYGASLVLMPHDGESQHGPGVESRKWVRDWWKTHEDEAVSPTTLIETVVTKSVFHRDKLALVRAGLVVREGRGRSVRYKLIREPGTG